MLQFFPWTRTILEELDQVLQAQANPPKWSLVSELTETRTADHLRLPEFSQPLVTALQLCIFAVLESWGVKASSVVGHSSGEIAASYAAGLLDRAGAIKAAFYRGRAAVNCQNIAENNVGMLAVGLGPNAAAPYCERYAGEAWIACFNSPSSVTVSGRKPALEKMAEELKAAGHFARLLQVDLAYHSELMRSIGEEYDNLLSSDQAFKPLAGSENKAAMFSSVSGSKKEGAADASYWKSNMVSPVRFADALKELITKDSPNLIIEVGPSGALAGPVSQVLKALPAGGDVPYCAAWARGSNAGKSLFDVAGRLFSTGAPIDMSLVNQYNAPKTLIDLPNYSWNHTIKYWHENAASRDWRNKRFITHDLLGAKIPGTAWEASPTWRKHLKLDDVPWLRDHKMGPDVLVPGAGLATLALEAMYQKYCALNPDEDISSPNELAYRFRNVKFDRAVVVEESKPTTIMLTLSKVPGSKDWHEFRIRTTASGVIYEHCSGLIRVQDPIGDDEALKGDDLAPLRHPQSAKLWYKAQREVGMGFGPTFQKIKSIESVSGSRTCRTIVSMEPPSSKWDPQSYYPVHPAVLDGCLQTATPANAAGERSLIKDTMIPALVDDMVINKMPKNVAEGLSVAESVYTGRGRKDVAKSWIANVAIHDPQTGALLMRVKGLNYIRLDVDEKPDPHVFHAVTWKPDISLLTQDQIDLLPITKESQTKIDNIIDLVAAKNPSLKILEINLEGTDTSALWFQGGDGTAREAYATYDFASIDAQALVSVQTALESKRNTEFHLFSPNVEGLGIPASEPRYDLVILKGAKTSEVPIFEVTEKLKRVLKPTAFTILMQAETASSSEDLEAGVPQVESTGDSSTPETSSSSGSHSPNETNENSLATSIATLDMADSAKKMFSGLDLRRLANGAFGVVKEISGTSSRAPAYLCSNATDENTGLGSLTIATFDETAYAPDESLLSALKESGWTVSTSPIEKIATQTETPSTILVLEELFRSVLTTITPEQWDSLKRVISTGKNILWVTKGGQTSNVTDPDRAMVQGFFRVARREDPLAKLTTLDVQSATGSSTSWSIIQTLRAIQMESNVETEYAERDGVLLLQRVRRDTPVNDFKFAESKGLEPVVKSLHATEAQVRIQAEKIGTLQSLTWCETAVGEVPMEAGMVEIEVMAVGVNFKVRAKRSRTQAHGRFYTTAQER